MTARLVEIGSFLTPAKRDEPVDRRTIYPMMGVRSFGRGPFSAAPLCGDATSYPTLRRVDEGDVVYPKLMAWEGAFALVPPELAGRWVSPEFCIFDVDESVADCRYVSHLVAWEGLRDGLLGNSSGTNARRRRLQPQAFLAHRVPLPSRPAQRRLAHHLDRFDLVSRHIVANESALTEQISLIIEGALQQESQTRSMPVGSILERDRDWFKPDDSKSYSPIGIRGFGRGIIHYAEVPRSGLAKLRFYRLRSDRLVVSNIKAWEGAVALTTGSDDGRIASNRFLQYRLVSNSTSLKWIQAYLLSNSGIAQLQSASPGSADRNRTLSLDSFESITIPMPSPERQTAVLALTDRAAALSSVRQRRRALAGAILHSARNEVFSALR